MNRISGRPKMVTANGITYKSITDCAYELYVDPSNLARYLRGQTSGIRSGLDKIKFKLCEETK